MKPDQLIIEVVCRHLPGLRFKESESPNATTREQVYLGIQEGDEVIEAVRADQKQVIFRPQFKIARQPDGSPNFLGPFSKGTPQERFFYLSWGVMDTDGNFEMFRRAKIHLNHLTWEQVKDAVSSDCPLRVVINMTDKKGGPLCASVRKDRADWLL